MLTWETLQKIKCSLELLERSVSAILKHSSKRMFAVIFYHLMPFLLLFFRQVLLQAVWIFSLPQALQQIGRHHCWQTTDETVTSSSTSMDGRQPIFRKWWCLRTSLNNSPLPHGWNMDRVLDWEARRRRCYVTRTGLVWVKRQLVTTGLQKGCFIHKWEQW